MSQQLQLRRGTESQIQTFTGAQGEVTPATDTMRLHVHDGVTVGGWVHALETRTAVADTNYAAKITDRIVAYTSITAARTVTLPSAASFPVGAVLRIIDESGAVSVANTVTILRSGSDTISGLTSLVLDSAYKAYAVESNGANAWCLVSSTIPLSAAIVYLVKSFNLNVAGDTLIGVVLPPGSSRYRVNAIEASNSQGALPTSARVGLYTAASQGGALVAAQQAVSITSQADATAGNATNLTITNQTTASYQAAQVLYLNVGTTQGASASVDIAIIVQPLL